MRRFGVGLALVFLLLGAGVQVEAYTIVDSEWSITYGDSWDNPSQNIEEVLTAMSGDASLQLVNGFNSSGLYGGIDSWYGTGAVSVILEELAGYKNQTTFGWYDVNNLDSNGEIFAGADDVGANKEISFESPTAFGFYIDPNGQSSDRMYSEFSLNGALQVAIFKVLGTDNQFILGWEDLVYCDGDQDFQDMIVRVTINSVRVPEPGTAFLLGAGLIGLAGIGRRRFAKR